MTCEHSEHLLMDAALDGHVSDTLREHAAMCPTCRASLDELFVVQEKLHQLPLPDSPAEVQDRFYASLGEAIRSAHSAPLTRTPYADSPPRSQRNSISARNVGPFRSSVLRWAASLVVAFLGGYLLHAALPTTEPPPARLATDLSNPAVTNRLGAVYAAASVPGSADQATPTLLYALRSDPSPNVRLAVVELLAEAGQDGNVRRGLLHAALTDPSPSVRVAAVRAIARTWPASAPPLVQQILGQPDVEPALRSHLIRLVSQPDA